VTKEKETSDAKTKQFCGKVIFTALTGHVYNNQTNLVVLEETLVIGWRSLKSKKKGPDTP